MLKKFIRQRPKGKPSQENQSDPYDVFSPEDELHTILSRNAPNQQPESFIETPDKRGMSTSCAWS